MAKSELKILSIVPYKVLPAKIGGEKGIALFNEYLGHECQLVAVGVKSNEVSLAKSYEFLKLISNKRVRYGNVFLLFTITRIIREYRPSHLIIEHPYFAWLAWLTKKVTKINWVIHSHNIEFQRSKSIGRWWWKALKWYELWAYRKADTVFFISERDRKIAVEEFGIDNSKSYAITYGIETCAIPADLYKAKATVRKAFGIEDSTTILLFNGSLYNNSNYDALTVILDEINPFLLNSGLNYKIIICGKGLPEVFNGLKDYKTKNVIYAGFVDDISVFFKAADIFLNPIMSGGGVKTKAIEAIAHNCTVISTVNGAEGIEKEICGEKLVIVEDGKWTDFAKAILSHSNIKTNTPQSFFEYYFWGNIAKKIVKILSKDKKKPLGVPGAKQKRSNGN